MKRIFVAVDLSAGARRAAADYIEFLRRKHKALRVGWERAEKLHLTLKFLGDTSDERLEKLKAVVRGAAANISTFELQIANTGVFPNARKARVLWINVVDERGSLHEINQKLETEGEKIGFARENRAYRPHLTIARLKMPHRDLIKSHLETQFEPIGFTVSEIVIYESKLQPTGSVYQKVESFPLQPHET